ncbi:hypothetical protein [Chamaesiphon polymorphus]|nr:hypothetical protein [Chamaesiphon polymorphus]
MLLTNTSIPTSLMVSIWSLRSVPISMLILMFVYNSGSTKIPHPNLNFWFDALAIVGIVGIIACWHKLKRLRWNVSFTIYLYIFLVLILRNPFGILTTISDGKITALNWQNFLHSLWVGVGIFGIGMLLEVLIYHLRQLKTWAWWLALFVSISYVSSIVFFFSGTLGIWSLLDPDTKQAFRHYLRQGKTQQS